MICSRIAPRNSRRHCSARTNAIEPLEGRVLLHAGDHDPSFGLGGHGASFAFGGYQEAHAQEIDVANGRVVVGGFVTNDGGATSRIALLVQDSSGRPVSAFSDDGYKTLGFSINSPRLLDMLVQPDNKTLLLVGNNAGQRLLARLNADGSLDSGFGQKTITLSQASDIARAPSGDVIVGGLAAGSKVALARFSSSGAAKSQLTTNFVAGQIYDVVVQSDGKPVVLVSQPTADGPTLGIVVRAKSDFTGLDTSFSGNGLQTLGPIVPEYGGELELDGLGRIVAAVETDTSVASIFRLLSSNGDLDSSFAESKSGTDVQDLSVSSDGKITLSGIILATGYQISRFNPNGGLDTGFGSGGRVSTGDNPFIVAQNGELHDVQPDGRIVTTSADPFGIVRLTANDATPVGTATLGNDGVLRITGTEAGNDRVGITDNGGLIFLELNGRQFQYDNSSVSRIEVSTLGGNDRVDNQTLFANNGDIPEQKPRTVHGGAGNDYIETAGGKDTLVGEDGNDQLHAGGGDDSIIDGPGTDLSDGGLGADTVDYSFRSGPVFVDLQGDADDGPAGEHDTVAASIEHIIGSKGNDTLTGDGRPNSIDGRGGNDTIRGGGGNDTLIGGLGQDKLYGEDGNDFLDARDGITDLVLDGGAGTDTARKDASDPRTSVEVLV